MKDVAAQIDKDAHSSSTICAVLISTPSSIQGVVAPLIQDKSVRPPQAISSSLQLQLIPIQFASAEADLEGSPLDGSLPLGRGKARRGHEGVGLGRDSGHRNYGGKR